MAAIVSGDASEEVKGVHNITTHDEFKAILESGDPFLLDCFATWCGPCKMIAPTYAKLSNENKNVKFYKFDVDELKELAQELGITAMPTFIAFKNGKKVDQLRGASPPGLASLVEKVIAA